MGRAAPKHIFVRPERALEATSRKSYEFPLKARESMPKISYEVLANTFRFPATNVLAVQLEDLSVGGTMQKERRPQNRRRRTIFGAALVLGVAGVVGLGAFATFTSTVSESQSATSGTMTLTVPGPGATNRLSVTASNIAPGDTIQRAIDLTSGGNLDISGFTLTTTATTTSALDTDATDGLQMVIEKCSLPWTESGPPYTYTCSGTTSTVLATSPWIQSSATLNSLSLTAGSTDNLRITLTFPSAADNTFQNLTSTVQYAFTATQRTAGPQ